RNVSTMHTGADDLRDCVIPAIALVFVLPLRTDVADLFLHAVGARESLIAPVVDTRLPACWCRPNGPGYQFQQLRLARTVTTRQNPTLAGLDAPADVVQHFAPATL